MRANYVYVTLLLSVGSVWFSGWIRAVESSRQAIRWNFPALTKEELASFQSRQFASARERDAAHRTRTQAALDVGDLTP